MNNIDRIFNLYIDWSSTQSEEKRSKMVSMLKEAIKETSKSGKVFEAMGYDGGKMKTLFEESWTSISENKTTAKRQLFQSLLEADEKASDKKGNFYSEFGLAYAPIADMADDGQAAKYSTNQMQSTISDGDRDILIQIRYAITSGNYSIAEALILNFWGRLSIKERVDIMTWAMNIGNYNSLVDVASSKGVNFKSLKDKIEKKEITKEEFKDAFIRTAKEKMKVE